MNNPITTRVEPNGQVYVNDVLVAEVTLGAYGENDSQVRTRDDLRDELSLHRIAVVVEQRLTDLIHFLEHGRGSTMGKMLVLPKERGVFGAAMVEAMLGEPGKLGGDPVYRDGRWAGEFMRAMRDHLQAVKGGRDPLARIDVTSVDGEQRARTHCPLCARQVTVFDTGGDVKPALADELRYHLMSDHGSSEAAA